MQPQAAISFMGKQYDGTYSKDKDEHPLLTVNLSLVRTTQRVYIYKTVPWYSRKRKTGK
jgi:hypothetical protein